MLEERPDDVEALYLAGCALLEIGRHGIAADRLRRALELAEENHPARLTLAVVLYETCQFEESRAAVDRVLDAEPDNAYAHYLSGLLRDSEGDQDAADACFRRAARLDGEHYTVPESIDPDEFDTAVEEALAKLPEEFRACIKDVPILVSPIPTSQLLEATGDLAPDLLGLFVGVPRPAMTTDSVPTVPATIHLFKRNLERAWVDREELVEVVGIEGIDGAEVMNRPGLLVFAADLERDLARQDRVPVHFQESLIRAARHPF